METSFGTISFTYFIYKPVPRTDHTFTQMNLAKGSVVQMLWWTSLPQLTLRWRGLKILLFYKLKQTAKQLNQNECCLKKKCEYDFIFQVLFFVAEDTVSIHKDLPLIRLKGVTDVYPPQKKSFAMLKWMADNYVNSSFNL